MSSDSDTLTPDEVQDEISRWLRADRFNVDWVTETDAVISDLLNVTANSLGGVSTRKALGQMIPSSTEYTLSIEVDPAPGTPKWVRVKLINGSRVVEQEVVDSSWWGKVDLPQAGLSDRLRRGAAAAAIVMLAHRYREPVAALHGIADPRVLFLLNEANKVEPAQRRDVVNQAARLDPSNRAVQFAIHTQDLREAEGDGTGPSDIRLDLTRRALEQVRRDSADDPMLAVRAAYNLAACGANSEEPKAHAAAHQEFIALYHDRLADPRLPAEFVRSVRPAIVTALAVTCRQTRCRQATDLARLAVSHSADPRATYNLACLYATTEVSALIPVGNHFVDVSAAAPLSMEPGCSESLAVAIEYLEMAVRTSPEYARMARTDRTLAALASAKGKTQERFEKIIAPAASLHIDKHDPVTITAGNSTRLVLHGTGFVDVTPTSTDDLVTAKVVPNDPTITLELDLTVDARAPAGEREITLTRTGDGQQAVVKLSVVVV